MMFRPCEQCGGTGRAGENPCRSCGGAAVVADTAPSGLWWPGPKDTIDEHTVDGREDYTHDRESDRRAGVSL